MERAFRVLKSELKIRPIHHWKEERMRSFISMYVNILRRMAYAQSIERINLC